MMHGLTMARAHTTMPSQNTKHWAEKKELGEGEKKGCHTVG